ncbi:hypothetical protein [Rhodococcus aetherivorans]|uniref:hypothetical protein n=1 Tax=Rhodococcus aetherivorans TaxID=191292 RepID=UPI001E54514B|nr:hypothetical protein [Rhodococcus aetherivorans]UGQ43400.1 hypothetical protein LRQ66_09015 [Rhodococcus aetherivorans]
MTIFRQRRARPRRRIFESVRSAEPAAFTQDEQRERRRQHLAIVYTGTFDLTAEIEAVLAPLARRPEVASYPHIVRELTVSVHELVLDLGKLLVERDARRRTAALEAGTQGRMTDLIVAAWERPECPTIDRDALVSGAWSSVLVEHVRPLTEPVKDYLAHAHPPGATGNKASVSERVEAALRTVDRAVRETERRLDHRETSRTEAPQLSPELRRLGASAAELRQLADLGVLRQRA